MGRIARQLGGVGSSQDMDVNGVLPTGNDSHSVNAMSIGGPDLDGGFDYGLSTGNAFVNPLSVDNANGHGLTDLRSNDFDYGLETFQLPDFPSDDTFPTPMDSQATVAKPAPSQVPNAAAAESTGPMNTLHAEQLSRYTSPLLCQLFNNEIFSRSIDTPAILTEKVQTMSFLDTKKDASDSEKLFSTISSEPYLMEVLDISIVSLPCSREGDVYRVDLGAFSVDFRLLPLSHLCFEC